MSEYISLSSVNPLQSEIENFPSQVYPAVIFDDDTTLPEGSCAQEGAQLINEQQQISAKAEVFYDNTDDSGITVLPLDASYVEYSVELNTSVSDRETLKRGVLAALLRHQSYTKS